jgi:transposase
VFCNGTKKETERNQGRFSIRSMRQMIKEIESNYAYRWFIGYDIGEEIPHFSTFGKNYSRCFKYTDIFEKIFTHILNEAVSCGFVDMEILIMRLFDVDMVMMI